MRRVGRFAALQHRFAVEVDSRGEGIVEDLRHVLAPLWQEGSGRLPTYRLGPVPGDNERWQLNLDDERVGERPSLGHAVAMLLWHVNYQAIQRSSRSHLLLHAGVVARNGQAVILPASMESGKATLVTALVERGWDYLSDEAALVTDDPLRVHAYPKPLSIDRGSHGLFPEVSARVRDLAGCAARQWHVPATDLRAHSIVSAARPAAVVFPQHVPDQQPAWAPLARSQAMVRAANCTFQWDLDAPARFQDLARLLRGVEHCATLQTGPLDETTALMETMLGPSLCRASR